MMRRGNGAGAQKAVRQRRLRLAEELPAGTRATDHDAQGEVGAAETLNILRGARTQPAPDAWLTTVGMMANDPIMHEVSEEGRRLRESEPPVE